MSTQFKTQGTLSGTTGSLYTATANCMVAIALCNTGTTKATLTIKNAGFALFVPTLYAVENGRQATFEKVALLTGQSISFDATTAISNVDFHVWGYTNA